METLYHFTQTSNGTLHLCYAPIYGSISRIVSLQPAIYNRNIPFMCEQRYIILDRNNNKSVKCETQTGTRDPDGLDVPIIAIVCSHKSGNE